MTETKISFPRCAAVALDAVYRLQAGTLATWHKDRPHWPAFRVPDEIILFPIDKPEVYIGDGFRNGNLIFNRRVQIRGKAHENQASKLLAVVDMKACTYDTKPATMTDDNGSWSAQKIEYATLEPGPDGIWKETMKTCSNLRGEPLL